MRLLGQKSGSMKTMSVRIFVVSFLVPSFFLILILLALYVKETIAAQEKEYVNTLNILSAHLINNMNADSSLSLTYLFETDTADFYYFLNEKDYTEDLYAYSLYERDYISDMNSRVTLLGDSMIGIGFLPYEANENRLFYLRKYDSLEVMENYSASEKGWYRYMDKNNQRPVFTPSDLEGGTAISLVRTVKDIDRQKIIGYVIVDISLDFIRESLDNITISPYSGIFLYSPQKELLFATSQELVPVVERLRAGGMDNYDLYSFTDDEFGFTLYYLSSRVDLYRSLTFAVLLGWLAVRCLRQKSRLGQFLVIAVVMMLGIQALFSVAWNLGMGWIPGVWYGIQAIRAEARQQAGTPPPWWKWD